MNQQSAAQPVICSSVRGASQRTGIVRIADDDLQGKRGIFGVDGEMERLKGAERILAQLDRGIGERERNRGGFVLFLIGVDDAREGAGVRMLVADDHERARFDEVGPGEGQTLDLTDGRVGRFIAALRERRLFRRRRRRRRGGRRFARGFIRGRGNRGGRLDDAQQDQTHDDGCDKTQRAGEQIDLHIVVPDLLRFSGSGVHRSTFLYTLKCVWRALPQNGTRAFFLL